MKGDVATCSSNIRNEQRMFSSKGRRRTWIPPRRSKGKAIDDVSQPEQEPWRTHGFLCATRHGDRCSSKPRPRTIRKRNVERRAAVADPTIIVVSETYVGHRNNDLHRRIDEAFERATDLIDRLDSFFRIDPSTCDAMCSTKHALFLFFVSSKQTPTLLAFLDVSVGASIDASFFFFSFFDSNPTRKAFFPRRSACVVRKRKKTHVT